MMSVWFPQKQTPRERFKCEQFIGEIKEMLCGECGGEVRKAAYKGGLSNQLSLWATKAHSH